MNEQAFMSALAEALGLRLPVRVWRQPAGTIPAKRGGAVKAAPVGAADLTGVDLRTGRRVEVEVKGATTRLRPEQRAWAQACQAWHVAYACVRLDPGLDLAANLDAGVAAVAAALGEAP